MTPPALAFAITRNKGFEHTDLGRADSALRSEARLPPVLPPLWISAPAATERLGGDARPEVTLLVHAGVALHAAVHLVPARHGQVHWTLAHRTEATLQQIWDVPR